MRRAVGKAAIFQDGREVVREHRRTEGCGEEAGQGHADLPGRKEAVGVSCQGGDLRTPPAARGQGLDLALAE
jgi:hypothetical protein